VASKKGEGQYWRKVLEGLGGKKETISLPAELGLESGEGPPKHLTGWKTWQKETPTMDMSICIEDKGNVIGDPRSMKRRP